MSTLQWVVPVSLWGGWLELEQITVQSVFMGVDSPLVGHSTQASLHCEGDHTHLMLWRGKLSQGKRRGGSKSRRWRGTFSSKRADPRGYAWVNSSCFLSKHLLSCQTANFLPAVTCQCSGLDQSHNARRLEGAQPIMNGSSITAV